MPVVEKELGKWGKRGQLLSIILVVCGLIYGITLYQFGGERDRNLVYTALFYDDMAVDLYRSNASFDAVAATSSVADGFCNLYEIEHRTLDWERYKPLCDAIRQRNSLLLACSHMELDCPESDIDDLYEQLEEAKPIAKDLKDNPPYYGYVLKFNSDNGLYPDRVIGNPIDMSWLPDAG